MFSVLLVVATLPFSLLFVVKVVQVWLALISDNLVKMSARNTRELSFSDLACC